MGSFVGSFVNPASAIPRAGSGSSLQGDDIPFAHERPLYKRSEAESKLGLMFRLKNSVFFCYINNRSYFYVAVLVMFLMVIVITLISVFASWSAHKTDLVNLLNTFSELPNFSKYQRHIKTHEGESNVKAMENHWKN